ncbi:MAG TPA: 3-dehydroquinate synthase [Chthoniobacterales bacterium]|nr:3-dehydroquinate synthase [Chthoniobacterales bacterium]
MISVEIQSARHPYRVLIAPGLLGQVGDALKNAHLPPGQCAIITDTNVGPLFAGALAKNLRSVGYEPKLITVPTGERAKTLEQAGEICEQMLGAGLDRQSFLIGLGGGVIGDLSGFVASIFERGIPHVQIATTLLAMVDSSIGGKTSVNARAGKNLIGAVHPPILVLDDVDVLKTLPQRELNQGFAEIIKHSIIADAEMFGQLEGVEPKNIDFPPLIRRNVELKARIVEQDEHEREGERALLNFGHTVGHGIERAADYRGIAHGEAVSLGMIAACLISMKKAGLAKAECDRIADLLHKFQLPTRVPKDFPREKIGDALKFDKKFVRGEIRFVVTPEIGSANLSTDVTMDDIRAAIAAL